MIRRYRADVFGSDHAPHTIEEKARPYPASPSGMPGVQTLVPILQDLGVEGEPEVYPAHTYVSA